MQIKKVKIDELKPHPANPRVHSEAAISKLKRGIEEFGWTNQREMRLLYLWYKL